MDSEAPRGRVDVPAVVGSRSAVALPIPVEQPVISTGRDFSIAIRPLLR